ncbi:MAG: GAF domain-containing sensor histidine kinase [Oscillochloridaceae bacterium]|nr:GAF domain-containing sensor histidine kinase [Chloroflexaceae bacterium]MDW8391940.1 GAF domain-containing sensor histidine kinase [Oscillochloridaceae bacterium]
MSNSEPRVAPLPNHVSFHTSRPDRFAELTAHLLRAPLALLILPETYGQWSCPSLALPPDAVNRALAACVYASQEQQPLVVSNLTGDPRFFASPLLRAPLSMRFLSLWPVRDCHAHPVGTICVLDRRSRRLDERERGVLDSLAGYAANEFLSQQLWASEELCCHFAAEVHDGVGQMLHSLYQQLHSLEQSRRFGGPHHRATLRRLVRLARQAVGETRRLIESLRPATLETLGLAGALHLLADTLRQDGWTIMLEERLGPERLAPAVELALFRVANEALTNAAKHTGERRAALTLARIGDTVRLEVRDWGPGFDPAHVATITHLGEKLGLRLMRERLAMLGGDLRVESGPGAGTLVVARVPAPPVPQRAEAGEASEVPTMPSQELP